MVLNRLTTLSVFMRDTKCINRVSVPFFQPKFKVPDKLKLFSNFDCPIGDVAHFTGVTKKSLSDLDVVQFIKSNLSKDIDYVEYLNDKDINIFVENITRNANNDMNIIKKRLAVVNMNAPKNIYFDHLFEGKRENAGFVLDNFDVIEKIFENRNFRRMGPDKFELEKIISKDNLQDIINHLNNDSNEKFIYFVKKLIYKSKKHDIKFGTETVKIDSSEIISLLSEEMSPSYFESGSTTIFNRAINRLTEITHRVESDDICPYYKLAEGILTQKPELAQIAKKYREYVSKYQSDKELVTYMKKFFNDMERSGQLPKEIELKTIVPDENALICQETFLDLFIERMNKGYL